MSLLGKEIPAVNSHQVFRVTGASNLKMAAGAGPSRLHVGVARSLSCIGTQASSWLQRRVGLKFVPTCTALFLETEIHRDVVIGIGKF